MGLLWWVSFPQYAGLEGRHPVVVPCGQWGFAWARRQAREEENHLTFLCRKDDWNQLSKSFPIIVDRDIRLPRSGDQSNAKTGKRYGTIPLAELKFGSFLAISSVKAVRKLDRAKTLGILLRRGHPAHRRQGDLGEVEDLLCQLPQLEDGDCVIGI